MKRVYRKTWRDNEGVSPVIATILMVAITVVLAGVLVVYMQSFSQGPGTSNAVATLSPQPFTNPEEGTAGATRNAGGWSCSVVKITGPEVSYSDATIALKDSSGALIAQLTTSAVTYSGALGNMNWYVLEYTGSTPQFWDYSASPAAKATVGATIGAQEFKTIEFAFMALLDNNGDNKVNAGDVIMVFKSYDADANSVADITSGSTIEIGASGDTVGKTTLT